MWCRGPELRDTHENWSRSRVTGQSLRGHTGIPINPPPTEQASRTSWAQNRHPPTLLCEARFLPFALPYDFCASGSLVFFEGTLLGLRDRQVPSGKICHPDAFVSHPPPFLSHVYSPFFSGYNLAFTWPFFYDSDCPA